MRILSRRQKAFPAARLRAAPIDLLIRRCGCVKKFLRKFLLRNIAVENNQNHWQYQLVVNLCAQKACKSRCHNTRFLLQPLEEIQDNAPLPMDSVSPLHVQGARLQAPGFTPQPCNRQRLKGLAGTHSFPTRLSVSPHSVWLGSPCTQEKRHTSLAQRNKITNEAIALHCFKLPACFHVSCEG